MDAGAGNLKRQKKGRVKLHSATIWLRSVPNLNKKNTRKP